VSATPKLILSALWLAVLAVAGVVGVVGIVKRHADIARETEIHVRPDSATEAIMASATGERDVPGRLAASVAHLPPGRAVLVLMAPKSMNAILPADIVSYTLWPRPVRIREGTAVDSPAALEQLRAHYGAVIFIGQKPPAGYPRGEVFGDFVFVSPLAES
jgi:hypothetical protein